MKGEADLIMGTFSKSFACIGGFVAGDEAVIHYLGTTRAASCSPPPCRRTRWPPWPPASTSSRTSPSGART